MKRSADVDAYIAGFPQEVRALLTRVRRTIRVSAPKATEVISYRIPAYKQHGMLVYFAGFKKHIGLFPQKVAAKYAGPKGNLKFPYDEPLPLALIARIVRYKSKQDITRMSVRKKK